MKVYLLNQTQESCGYLDTTIGVFTDKAKAEEVCKDLNDNFFVKDEHYYTVKEMTVNENYWISGIYLDLLTKIPKTRKEVK